MAHYDDVEALVKLLTGVLRQIKSGQSFKYFDR
jgi:hypothetical protein